MCFKRIKVKQHINSRGIELKILKIILTLVVITISAYGLITKDFSYGPISSLLLGIFFAVLGIEELKNRDKNSWGKFNIAVSVLIVAMALFSF